MSDQREKAIRERAYALWEKSGSPHGQHGEHWDQAVREIDAEAGAKGKPGRKAGVKPASAPVAKAKLGGKPKRVAPPVEPKPIAKAPPRPVAAAKSAPAPKSAAAAKATVAAKPAPVSAPAKAVSKAKQAAESVVASVKRATKGATKK